jgi:GNAT superfamily N-acetyltransferase
VEDYKYIKIGSSDGELKSAYHKYTRSVFGFDLELFDKQGQWTNRYIPNSYISNNGIIANISASIMKLQLNKDNIEGVQLGAVGVLEEYRKRGLAKKLMNRVFQEYKHYPLIFLFASDDVSQFYIKCGFKKVDEITPYIEVKDPVKNIEPLKVSKDFIALKRLLSTGLQYSTIIDSRGNENIYWFHMLYNHSGNIYYIEEKDMIFIADYDNDTVNLYDILSENKVSFDELKPYILKDTSKVVKFHFTPDWLDVDYNTMINPDNSLYVYGSFPENIKSCRFPSTSVT